MVGAADDVPVVVVRNSAGLAGFVNVCRHRRHEVMSGCGSAKVLQCPYHAWTYDLTGCLKAAPRSEREADFRKEELSLLPVRVETWGPWVFVNLDAGARPLREYLGDLPDIIGRSGLDLTRLQFKRRYEWRRHANWKVMIENYLECYHCPVQHPGFSAVIDVDQDAYTLKSYAWHSSQVAPVPHVRPGGHGQEDGLRRARRGDAGPVSLLLAELHDQHQPRPAEPFRGRVAARRPRVDAGFSEYYFGLDVTDAFARDLMAFSEQVGNEDDSLTSSVQRGVRGFAEPGKIPGEQRAPGGSLSEAGGGGSDG